MDGGNLIKPEDIIVLRPGETAPPVKILLPNGSVVAVPSVKGLPDDIDAWIANMEASDPGDIE
jgi:hypothetical protein